MKPCPLPLWESLVREDPTATFFQTPAWLGLAARHHGAESAPLLFEFPQGPACLPLLRDRRWGRLRYFSPLGTYAALLCARALSAAELATVERELAGLNLHLVSSPFTRNPVAVGARIPARVQSLDLTAVDPANVMGAWEKGQRRWTRVAERESLTVRLADSNEDWDAYYKLYELSLARWGDKATRAYPSELFREIRDLPPASRTLWLAEKDGVIGAGVLALDQHRHRAVWHSAADAVFFEAGATQLLYLRMVTDSVRDGFAELDFLGSAGLAGVEAFKTRFGTRPLTFESSLNRTGLVGALAALRDRLGDRLSKRLRGARAG